MKSQDINKIIYNLKKNEGKMKIKKIREFNENIELKRTMDDYSKEIYRNNKYIGNLLWHESREPRIRLNEESEYYLTISEIEYILKEFERILSPLYHL